MDLRGSCFSNSSTAIFRFSFRLATFLIDSNAKCFSSSSKQSEIHLLRVKIGKKNPQHKEYHLD